MKKESFIVHSDDAECVDALSDEGAGKLFKALLNYSKSGKLPELSGAEFMAFMFMKKQLDKDKQKYEEICERRKSAGALGGRPKKGEEKVKGFCEEVKKANGFSIMQKEKVKPDTDTDTDKDTETETDTDTETDIDTDTVFFKSETQKKAYGMYENVFLTDGEIEIIKKEYKDDFKKRIDRLSEYIEQTGKQYKSHFATIRVWARKEAEKAEKERSGTAFSDNSYDSGKLELLSRS